MTTKAIINNHANEEGAISSAGSDTVAIFDAIWNSLDSSAAPNFVTFKQALEDALTVINKMRNEIANRRNALSTNRGLVDNSVVRIAAPVLPSMDAAIGTVSNLVAGHISVDIQRLNVAMGITRGVRTPTDVTGFEKQKIAQISARLSDLFAELSLSQGYIETIKKVVENKLSGV